MSSIPPEFKIRRVQIKKKQKKRYNKRIYSLFQMMIMNQLTEQKMNEDLQHLTQSLPQSLVAEMKKEKIPERTLVKLKNLISLHQFSNDQRNIPLMILIFKRIPAFKKFLGVNKIDELTLREICNSVNYLFVKEGDYVFKKDDYPDNFYCIISGKISIRRPDLELMKKFPRKSLEQSQLDEKEICVLESGDYFGDWGLLDCKLRCASAIAKEDCDLFYLTKEKFEHTISRNLRRSYNEIKGFLKNALPPFVNMGKFDYLWKSMNRNVYRKNEIVFKQGDIANGIYLIYEGEFSLKKRVLSKQVTIINLSKGEFAGLESIENFYETRENNKKRFESTVVSNTDFNIACSLNIDLIKKYFSGELKSFLLELRESREKILGEFSNRFNGFFTKNRVIFREALIKKKMEFNSQIKIKNKEKLFLSTKKEIEKKPRMLKTSLSNFFFQSSPSDKKDSKEEQVTPATINQKSLGFQTYRTYKGYFSEGSLSPKKVRAKAKRRIKISLSKHPTRNKENILSKVESNKTLTNFKAYLHSYDSGCLSLPLVTELNKRSHYKKFSM